MIKVIACAIYKPYIEQLGIDETALEITYLEIQQHNHPKTLSKNIQKEIDQTKHVSKILILYGLCGNALLNIVCHDIPVVLIRVHDCLSILLGSKKRYEELFKDRLSSAWSCYALEENGSSWIDDKTYLQWCQLYDEETVSYLQECLSQECNIYVTMHLPKEYKYETKKEVIEGDLCFLKEILTLTSKELVILKPGQRLASSVDREEVFTIKED